MILKLIHKAGYITPSWIVDLHAANHKFPNEFDVVAKAEQTGLKICPLCAKPLKFEVRHIYAH